MTAPATSHLNLALELLASARKQGHRRLIQLCGDAAACRHQAQQLLQSLAPETVLWVGQEAPAGVTTLTNLQALQRLGGEVNLLIYDAFSGFDPDAFGALSGTLRGGGLLLLLSPRPEAWPGFADPEYERLVVAGQKAADFGGGFIRRLDRLLQSDSYVGRVVDGQVESHPPPMDKPPLPAHHPIEGCLTPDQHKAVVAIEQVVHGHRKRPLVLSSDRGRGKSSALGIAAARLMRETGRRILVTAPRRSAVDALFQQAQRLLPEAGWVNGELHLAQSSLVYTAPDHLLASPQQADLLLIDEAAAIPAALLQALLKDYPRLVFATTLHGYEGTGRGFALRFRQYLDRLTPQWREHRLVAPIRWAQDDPLEPLVFRLLGLDCEPAPDKDMAGVKPSETELLIPDRSWLLQHEDALQQLFGLLVLAHYRTRPLDLRLLLDAPNLQILLLRRGENIAAAALVAVEGEFDSELAEAIWAGERRPRGHLMAQSLAAHVGLSSAPQLKGLRAIRIAVHPATQRCGLGSQLVEAIGEYAARQGCDYLGTSFGLSRGLLRFWRHNRLWPVRLGLRSQASSGEHALLMIRPITGEGEQMADRARQRFTPQLLALLGDPLRHLPASMAASLLRASGVSERIRLTDEDWIDLAGFAYRHRGYETCLPAIERLVLRGLDGDTLPTDAEALLVMRVVQRRSWASCARFAGVSGRAETEVLLRGIMADLFQRIGDENALEILNRFTITP